MVRKALRLNFYYWKIIRFLHLPYHLKILGYILKNVQKNGMSALRNCVINHNENENNNEK